MSRLRLTRSKAPQTTRFAGKCPTKIKLISTGVVYECFDRSASDYCYNTPNERQPWKRDNKELFEVIDDKHGFVCEDKKCNHITNIIPKDGQLTCGCEKCGWNAIKEDLVKEEENSEIDQELEDSRRHLE